MIHSRHTARPSSRRAIGLARRDRHRAILKGFAALFAGVALLSASPPADDAVRSKSIVLLSNGRITIGADAALGGAITYLAAKDGRNVVNNHDLGREIQQSYYSGPTPFGHPTGPWAHFGWNPIGSGDNLGHHAVAEVKIIGKATLYVRSTPYQWALDRVPCECRFESWITLSGDQVHVRQRLTNGRSDHAQYPANSQELPAVYVNGFLRHIVTYTGDHPFTGDALARPAATWPTRQIVATENWLALTDARDIGLGVINMATNQVDTGVTAGKDGGEHDDQTGYISPRRADILDHNIVYDTDYTLVLGSVAEIRAAAFRLKPSDPRPVYRFRTDREGWSYVNAQDSGWPIAGRLHVTATQNDPQMMGPGQAFSAAGVPALYVTAAFTGGNEAQLFWATADQPGFAETRSIKFSVIPDQTIRTVRIPTGSIPSWTGLITSLRFDPPGAKGAKADICAIAWRPIRC